MENTLGSRQNQMTKDPKANTDTAIGLVGFPIALDEPILYPISLPFRKEVQATIRIQCLRHIPGYVAAHSLKIFFLPNTR